jgi:carboxymethylenebutenolidase
MSDIIIPAKDGGSFAAYVAMPKVLPAPCVIMIQEIFGINAEMRNKCDAMAKQGFIAVAPDLFWRLEPNVQLTDKTEAEWAKAFDLFNRFDVEKGVEDLRSTAHTFKGHAECSGKVGAVGYCLGGKLAYLMATRSSIDASVSYYGVGLDALLSESARITRPLMLHIAEEDKYVSKDAQVKIKDALKNHPYVTLHSYAGVNHAFSRTGGEHFNATAAALASQRTLEFLVHNLDLTTATQ